MQPTVGDNGILVKFYGFAIQDIILDNQNQFFQLEKSIYISIWNLASVSCSSPTLYKYRLCAYTGNYCYTSKQQQQIETNVIVWNIECSATGFHWKIRYGIGRACWSSCHVSWKDSSLSTEFRYVWRQKWQRCPLRWVGEGANAAEKNGGKETPRARDLQWQ